MSNNDDNRRNSPAKEMKSHKNDGISRRELVLMGGGTIVPMFLAGCSGGGGEDGPGGNGGEGTGELGPAVDPILDVIGDQVPTDLNRHPIGTEGYGWTVNPHVALRNPRGGNWYEAYVDEGVEEYPVTIQDVTVEDNAVEYTYNQDITWTGTYDGDEVDNEPINAWDRYYHWDYLRQYDELTGASNRWSELEVVDDATIRCTQEETIHPALIRGNYMRGPGPYREIMKPLWEEMNEATTQEEAESIHGNYTDKFLGLDEAPVNTLFQVESFTNDQIVLTKREDGHPWVDQQNIQTIRYTLAGDLSSQRQRFQNGDVDFGIATPPGTELPDKMTELEKPIAGMLKYHTSHLGPLSNIHLRRAVNYVVSSEYVVQNSGSNLPVDTWTGMTSEADELFLSSELRENQIAYGSNTKESEAEREMDLAGYSKDGNNWVKDGETLELTVFSLNWWEDMHKTVVSQLEAFGINVESKTGGFGKFNEHRHDPETTGWDMMAHFQGMGYEHPARYFGQPEWVGNYKLYNPQREEWGWAGKSVEVEFPEQPGTEDIDGAATKTVNLREASEKLTDPGTSREELKSLTEDYAQWINYSADIVPFMRNASYAYYNEEDFVVEGFDDPELPMSVHTGTIRGKEQ